MKTVSRGHCMKRIGKFFLGCALSISMLLSDASVISVFASASYIGIDDDLAQYTPVYPTQDERTAYKNMDKWIYNRGTNYAVTNIGGHFDHGSVINKGSYLLASLDWPGDQDGSDTGVDIKFGDISVADWDMFVADVGKGTASLSSGFLDAAGSRFGGNFLTNPMTGYVKLDGTAMPDDSVTYGDYTQYSSFLTQPATRVLADCGVGCTAFLLPGGHYERAFHRAYLSKGGVVIEIDNNGGKAGGRAVEGVLLRQDRKLLGGINMYDVTLFDTEGGKLVYRGNSAREAPRRSGYTFAGYELVDEQYFSATAGGMGKQQHKVSFTPDGSHLKVYVEKPGDWYRYVIKLKAKWVRTENAKSTLHVDYNDGSTPEGVYEGRYFDVADIQNPYQIDGYTVTYNANPVNGDSPTGVPGPQKTKRTFGGWDYKVEDVRGWVRPETDGSTITRYTFLGADDEESTIKAKWDDGAISLPTPVSTKKYAFIGWYDQKYPFFSSSSQADAAAKHLVGIGGQSVVIHQNMTLYAGWMKLTAKYEKDRDNFWTDTSFNKSGISVDGSGIGHNPYALTSGYGELGYVRWNTVAKDSAIQYRVYYSTVQPSATDPKSAPWEIMAPFGTNLSSYQHTKTWYPGQTVSFQAPATGTYTIYVKAGNGGSAGGYSGGLGAYVSETVYLRRGQSITGFVGANGGSSSTGTAPYGVGAPRGAAGRAFSQNCGDGSYDTSDSSHSLSVYRSDGAYSRGWSHSHKYEHGDHCGYWIEYYHGCGTWNDQICHISGVDYGVGCNDHWHSCGQSYNKGNHRKSYFPAGGGGGASVLSIDGTLYVACGGGAGASYNSRGISASNFTNKATWDSHQGVYDSTANGAGGHGGGQGCSYVNYAGNVKVAGASVSGGSPMITITYNDYTVNDAQYMHVLTPDLASPNGVNASSYAVKSINQSDPNYYNITLTRPSDRGTQYWYIVSMDSSSNTSTTLQDSDPISRSVTSGIKGYYYLTDMSPSTTCTVNNAAGKQMCSNGSGANNAGVGNTDTLTNVLVNTSHRYLHVAPVDYCGNLGPTTHYYVPLGYTVVFKPNNPTDVMSTKKDKRNVQGTMPNQYIPINVTEKLNKNQFTRYGYTFQGWARSAVPPYGTVELTDQQAVRNLAPSGGSITLYAVWNPNKHNIIYDKNFENATLGGEPSVVLDFDAVVDTPVTAPSTHYINRYGWTFKGWYWVDNDAETARNAEKFFQPGELYLLRDYDITLYAIVNRTLTLRFAEDYVTDVASEASAKDFNRTIWNHVDTFQFRTNDVVRASTRTKGTYTATFMKNGDSTTIDMGGVTDEATGREVSTNLKSNGTIIGTRYFVGWSERIQATGRGINKFSKMTDFDGTIIGGTGSTFDAKCYDTAQKYRDYDVKGNKATVTITNPNNLVTVYPQYTRTYIVLPDARRHIEKGPDDGTEKDGNQEDTFIGWFTLPQPDNGESGDGGEYYGGPGDLIRLDGDVKLYPWFNIAPTIVRSHIGEDLNDPELGDGFFEGQPVTHDQLLALVDAFDEDNPEEIGPDGYSVTRNGVTYNVEFNGTHSWFDFYLLQAELMLRDAYPELSDEEVAHILSDNINKDKFWPTITGITYYQDGTDKFGNPYPAGVPDTEWEQDHDDVVANGLNTAPENVGRIVIHYSITDNGTFANGIQILKGNMSQDGVTPYTVDSPITVNFDLDCNINYNYNPRLDLVSTYMYTGDEAITKDNIEEFLWKKQDATDREDDRDRKPWWYKSETATALDDSIKIIGVYDIRFESGYYQENKTKCQNIQKIVDIKELFDLKETDYEAFKHITSFKVEWDCVDQWGKTASGYLMPGYDYEHNGGYNVPNLVGWKQGDPRPELPYNKPEYVMTKEERTMMVIMFNNEDDYDLLHANVSVSERMRYIDSAWVDYLSEDSYWGDDGYGKDNLSQVFENYERKTPASTSQGTMENHGSTIQIRVNDYSE